MELVNVARKRGLGDIEAAARQLAAQLVLTGDGLSRDQLADRGVPFGFGGKFAQTKLTGDLKENGGRLPGSLPRLCMYKNTAVVYKYTSNLFEDFAACPVRP
jgi:hypothetical protein